MRTILLTSTFLRHRYVMGEVAQRSNLVGVWQEEHQFDPRRGVEPNSDDALVVMQHFAARDRSEQLYFDERVKSVAIPRRILKRQIPPNGVNDPQEIELMASLQPHVILVYGCGLLRRQLIERFEGRLINMHLGLSPYYRGSGSNFWPLVNREPEYVGVTIHYIDPGIDSGPIICHGRPGIQPGDGPHDIGNKAIIVGTDLLITAAAERHQTGSLPTVPQAERGRLYQMKGFNADAVRKLYRNFETGMIEEYLSDKARRDSALQLVHLPGKET